ncbi:MAG: hypothetical protein GEU93_20750 [Propionibacteriales bacterium]|nr:hypothetical protein [Propionibacteriales bacterium]
MSERITPQQFHGAVGSQDRRVVSDGAGAHFRAGSFAAVRALSRITWGRSVTQQSTAGTSELVPAVDLSWSARLK